MIEIGYVKRYQGKEEKMGIELEKKGWVYKLLGEMIGWMGVEMKGQEKD